MEALNKLKMIIIKPIKVVFLSIPILLISMSMIMLKGDSFSGPPVKKDRNLNVLLITIDTIRADRVGCYGYSKAETPNMDRLASNGVKFSNAYCQVPFSFWQSLG